MKCFNYSPLSEETQEPMSSRKVGHAVAHWVKNRSGLNTNTDTNMKKYKKNQAHYTNPEAKYKEIHQPGTCTSPL